MDGKMFARLGAVLFAIVAITAAVFQLGRKEEVSDAWPSGRAVTAEKNPLLDQLLRCQALGEAAGIDTGCRQAWAESRKRFLTPGPRPVEPPRKPTPAPAEVQ